MKVVSLPVKRHFLLPGLKGKKKKKGLAMPSSVMSLVVACQCVNLLM